MGRQMFIVSFFQLLSMCSIFNNRIILFNGLLLNCGYVGDLLYLEVGTQFLLHVLSPKFSRMPNTHTELNG